MKKTAVHDTWLTPKYFFDQLNERFEFDDFDPCPPDNDISKFDGLQIDWPERTFCNPPYSRFLKEAFIRKALAESLASKLVVLLVPVSTSTRIFHSLVMVHGRVEFILGRLPFEGIDSDGNWCNPGMGMVSLPHVPVGAKQIKRSGQVDLMLIIFGQS